MLCHNLKETTEFVDEISPSYLIKTIYKEEKYFTETKLKNLATPKAILFGFGLIALAIAFVSYSSTIIKPTYAISNNVVANRLVDKINKLRQDILADHNQLYAMIKQNCK